MSASEQAQPEAQQPEEQPEQRPGAGQGQGAGQQSGQAGGAGKKAKRGDQDARVSGDQARKDKITDKIARERFNAQAQRVSPGAYGQNLDKAGLRPLRANELGPDKNVSKKAVAAAPSSWRDRVIAEVPSEQVAPEDPGHTYHVLDDQTVVSTSDPAVVDNDTAAKAANAAGKKAADKEEPPPQVTEIVKQIEDLQIQISRHNRTRSTDLKTPEVITEARAKVKRLRTRLDEVEGAGTDKKTLLKVRFRLDRAVEMVDAAENEHHRAVKEEEAKKKKTETEGGDGADDGKTQSKTQKVKKWLGDNSDVKGEIVKKEVSASATMFGDDKAQTSEGPLGAKRISKHSALSAEAKATAEVGIGKDGLKAEASAEAKAQLVDLQERWEWNFPFELLGEKTEATLYLFAKGTVGAEAKAQISANVKALSPKSPKLDENEIMAGVGGFAGAKVQLGVGAAYEWKKKPLASYAGKLKKSAKAIIRLITAANPALGWVLKQLDGDEAAAQMLEWLFSWGATGKVPLVGIEAMGEGSAGIGAQAMVKAGIKGGKLDFMAKANATFGLGLGGMVKVMLDIVEGPKYAVLLLGELLPMAEKYAREQIDRAIQSGLDTIGALWDWLSADDKAREAVANGAHKVLGVKERGKMIKTMMSGYCGDADEDAILTILKNAKGRGDLWRVVVAAGGSSDILWALDGAQDTAARKVLGL
ncbi:MAG: hypothetical protein KC502_13745 [Myxococcales bacterium]|nr:hypothetical protein [Myxococcales bacterium]